VYVQGRVADTCSSSIIGRKVKKDVGFDQNDLLMISDLVIPQFLDRSIAKLVKKQRNGCGMIRALINC
jgi:hypothetical protein